MTDTRRSDKNDMILEGARRVFCRRGFLGVTMKDIIEECGISRGGIYLYYASVEEIFRTSVTQRNKSKFEDIRRSVEGNVFFFDLLDSYFERQRDRLLNIENSMLRSMYEYLFAHPDTEFLQLQLDHIQETIGAILRLGVRQGLIEGDNLNTLAEHFMLTIEGFNILALLGGLTAEHLDRQFALMKSMLVRTGGSPQGGQE